MVGLAQVPCVATLLIEGDVFVDHLGTPLIWVPHSYNGCKQHGPDEHFAVAMFHRGIDTAIYFLEELAKTK